MLNSGYILDRIYILFSLLWRNSRKRRPAACDMRRGRRIYECSLINPKSNLQMVLKDQLQRFLFIQ
jgi:hypothetical protein